MRASVSASTLMSKVSERPLCDYSAGDGKWTVLTYMALLCHYNGTQALYTVPQEDERLQILKWLLDVLFKWATTRDVLVHSGLNPACYYHSLSETALSSSIAAPPQPWRGKSTSWSWSCGSCSTTSERWVAPWQPDSVFFLTCVMRADLISSAQKRHGLTAALWSLPYKVLHLIQFPASCLYCFPCWCSPVFPNVFRMKRGNRTNREKRLLPS